MNDDLKLLLDDTKNQMERAMAHLASEFAKVRAGKAMPSMLDGIMVDAYGSHTPLNQVGSVNTPDARTLVIQPWDKSMIQAIEKAITESNLGLNPQNDGIVVRLNIPPLTEERRKLLVKTVKTEGEQGKVTVRNIRKDANERIKKMQKDGMAEDEAKEGETKVQQLTDQYIARVDQLTDLKEKEIMTV